MVVSQIASLMASMLCLGQRTMLTVTHILIFIVCLARNMQSNAASSPLSLLQHKSEVYTIKDNQAKTSAQVLSLSLIFDQQVYFLQPGCGGKPKPIGARMFGFKKKIGNIHAFFSCNGTILSSRVALPLLPLPTNSFQTLNKYTALIQKEKAKALEGNVAIMLVDIPGKAMLRDKMDIGTCVLRLESCRFSTDMPGGSISNFAGIQVLGEVKFQESDIAFQPPIIMVKQLSFNSASKISFAETKGDGVNLLAENLVGFVTGRTAGTGPYMRKWEEEGAWWIQEQVTNRVVGDLTGKSDSNRPGGMHLDPLNFLNDLLKKAGEAGAMLGEGIKLAMNAMKDKIGYLISQASVAFLETDLIKLDAHDPKIAKVQMKAMKKVIQQTFKRVNKTTHILYDALNKSIYFTKSLNELHELSFAFDSQVERLGRLIDKGEFWNQYAYDTAEATSEKYQHIIALNEHAVNSILRTISRCKQNLQYDQNTIEKALRTIILNKRVKSGDRIFFTKSELDIKEHKQEVKYMIQKYTKEREMLNLNIQRREEEGSFLEAKTNAELMVHLDVKNKATLFELLKQGHYLHTTGQAKTRIEADQWIELGAGTSVDSMLGIQHTTQTSLNEEDRFLPNLWGFKGSPTTSMPEVGTVAKRLVKVLSHSLTSELAKMLTDRISNAIQGEVVPLLVDRVLQSVPNRVAVEVSDGLTTGLQTPISEIVPTLVTSLLTHMLEKTMFRSLVDLLTRGMTHTLTSTLTYTLSMGSDEHVYCYKCKHQGMDCDKCKDHFVTDNENMLALDYYASYYSDYYSDYYSVRDVHHEHGASDPEGITPPAFASPNMEL